MTPVHFRACYRMTVVANKGHFLNPNFFLPLTTGLSDKLHSIPTEALHEAPREVKIDRGDGEICLDEMGRPKGFDAEAVLAKSSSPALLPRSNGLKQPQNDLKTTSKAEEEEENGLEVDHHREPSEVQDVGQSSVVHQSDVSHMPKGAEEETTTTTGEENPQTVPEDVKRQGEVERREEFEDDASQEEVQEKGDVEGPAEQEFVEGGANDNEDDVDDDDFGDFDSAFAPSNNNVIAAAADIPTTAFPAPPPPPDSEQSTWSVRRIEHRKLK